MIHGIEASPGLRRGSSRRKLRAGALAALLVLGAGAGISVAASDPSPTTYESLVRLNAGGDSFLDWQGQTWEADSGTGGTTASTGEKINGAWDQQLFQSQRTGAMSYALPLEAGTHTVRLYFAAIAPSSGPFDVSFEGQPLIQGYDIDATVGTLTADVAQLVVDTDSTLDITFSEGASLAGIEVLREVDVDTLPETRMTEVPTEPQITEAEPVLQASPAPTEILGSDVATQDELSGVQNFAPAQPAVAAAPTDEIIGSDQATESDLLGQQPAPNAEPVIEVRSEIPAPNTRPLEELPASGLSTVSGESAYRMNVGGSAVLDADGKTWRADKGTGGAQSTIEIGADSHVSLGSSRVGPQSFHLPVLNGSYQLDMAFLASQAFDTKIEGVIVTTGRAVEAGSLDTLSVPVTVTDGVLDIELTSADELSPSLTSIELLMPSSSTPPVTPVSSGDDSTVCTLEMLMVDGIAVTEHPGFVQPVQKDENCRWVDGNGEPIATSPTQSPAPSAPGTGEVIGSDQATEQELLGTTTPDPAL